MSSALELRVCSENEVGPSGPDVKWNGTQGSQTATSIRKTGALQREEILCDLYG